METSIKSIQAQILGAALVEILNGRLSDETIAVVDTIKRNNVPEVFSEIVGFMHGMSTTPQMRPHVITHLLREIRGIANELVEEREKNPAPIVY
ncbi:MAG TPA: hypothetical protein VJM08_11785 [Anaerolineales bacterium]|nr:hypothetical protein [Anaerolineales bacterium]